MLGWFIASNFDAATPSKTHSDGCGDLTATIERAWREYPKGRCYAHEPAFDNITQFDLSRTSQPILLNVKQESFAKGFGDVPMRFRSLFDDPTVTHAEGGLVPGAYVRDGDATLKNESMFR